MAIIRLDSNNNNSKNNSKWKMFFDKINNGSSFGVIKEVFFYDFPYDWKGFKLYGC